jgi:hypothetical protein
MEKINVVRISIKIFITLHSEHDIIKATDEVFGNDSGNEQEATNSPPVAVFRRCKF